MTVETFFPPCWFIRAFGIEEDDDEIEKNLFTEETDHGTMIHSKQSKQIFNAGRFSIKSLNDFNPMQKVGNGKLNIVCGNDEKTYPRYYYDLMELQNIPDFDGCTVFISTNFSCLSILDIPNKIDKYLTTYAFDQSISCLGCLSAFPSLVHRRYFEHPNLLQKTPLSSFVIDQGDLKLTKEQIKKILQQPFPWKDISNYSAGVVEDAEICLRKEEKRFAISSQSNKDQTNSISQVFGASFDFNSVELTPFTVNAEKIMLEAEYRIAILQAWSNSLSNHKKGSKKLFLTLIEDNYNVPLQFIFQAISSQKQLIIDSGLDVYLLCPNPPVFKFAHKYLKNVVEFTKGQIIHTEILNDEELLDKDVPCCFRSKTLLFISSIIIIFFAFHIQQRFKK